MRTIKEQLQESLEIFMKGFPEKHKEYYKMIKKYIEDKKKMGGITMSVITEDFVSFETAKLLKEKGFDEGCPTTYTSSGFFHTHNYRPLFGDIFAPTLQMAMKWLREVHNLHITIFYSSFLYDIHPYYWNIVKMDSIPRENAQIETSTNTHDYSFAHYEKCCEAAIKYCLENLI